MKNINKFVIGILILFGLIQFIRPNKYKNSDPTFDDIIVYNKPPQEVAKLLRSACYDCHSNETKSYWYDKIAPATWLIDYDVAQGKEHLNFSKWEQYSFDKKIKLAGEIMYQIYDKQGMPLKKYVLMHKEADLTKNQQNKITNWINSLLE